jgi:hypothetical protein
MKGCQGRVFQAQQEQSPILPISEGCVCVSLCVCVCVCVCVCLC